MTILSKEFLRNINEDRLCLEVLIPLLQAMQFRDVTYTHGGSGEQGKDIVCWKEDELGSRRNYALVVKAIKVTGKAKVAKGTAGEIITQIQQCFGESYLDPITSESELVHQCWVISSQQIGKEAEKAIRSSLSPATLERNVQFVDGDRLWEYIERYMPLSAIWSKLEDVGKTLGQIDSHYQPKVTLEPNSNIHFELVEKFPGAAKEKPITISTIFQFPQTPEGDAARNAFEKTYKTGEPADIPLQYLQSINLPDFLAPLVKLETLQKGVMSIGEVVSSPHIFVKIKVVCDDGSTAVIDYIDLAAKWSGNQKITLENKELGNPFHIELELIPEQKFANFKITTDITDVTNVYQLLNIYNFQNCLSKPFKLNILNRENNLLIFSQSSHGICTPVELTILEELKDLIEIQNRVKIPINIPARRLSEEERRSISHLRAILHRPNWTKDWDYLDVELSPEGIEDFLDIVVDRDDLFFRITEDEKEELFGSIIPIGEVQITYRHARVENLGEIRGRKGSLGSGESIKVHLVPNELESVVEIEYLGWMTKY
jgi:hypothetical protein